MKGYANDTGIDSPSTMVYVLSQPSHGYLDQDWHGNVTYTADNWYTGPDSFKYQLYDGDYSNIATVNIDVTNTAPVASDKTFAVLHGRTLSNLDLKAGASDADGDDPYVVNVTQPEHGYLNYDYSSGK